MSSDILTTEWQKNSFDNLKVLVSEKVVFEDSFEPAIIIVFGEKIWNIRKLKHEDEKTRIVQAFRLMDVFVEDFGNLVLMPGAIDYHVHVNEPGRTDWEGFETATKAAAAGGVTTIFDMPLNSIPVTTSIEHLITKVKSARSKTFVDVGFWGGHVPGNENDLLPMIEAGVVGFKSFMCNSGIDDFLYCKKEDIKRALKVLDRSGSLLIFHAELQNELVTISGDPSKYMTYLKSRPQKMEVDAVKMITKLCTQYEVGCHVVHLSASEALNVIREEKLKNPRFTVESCPHYLHFVAEKIPDNATEYKCSPPIREAWNKERLWNGVREGLIDMVVSDHSPCTKDLKTWNFMTAWGGVSSVQFTLSTLWTELRQRNFSLMDLSRLISKKPAELCRVDNKKGCLKVGLDADFVVWDPEDTITIQESNIHFKNKLTPYMGKTFYGKIYETYVRGRSVYKNGTFVSKALVNYC